MTPVSQFQESPTNPVQFSSTLSSDVDDFKAVAWWYDKRHEDGVAIDVLDLYLKTTGGTTLRGSSDAWDEKERVYHDNIGGNAVELQISGYDVTADGVSSCGTDSMLVYYAYF